MSDGLKRNCDRLEKFWADQESIARSWGGCVLHTNRQEGPTGFKEREEGLLAEKERTRGRKEREREGSARRTVDDGH
ncbi:hypothetical protein M0802_005764 [Mischocyttarus mexicanus]|nr:hypothetical protein M0802_005764 [Mischocyttarus mexicanus]